MLSYSPIYWILILILSWQNWCYFLSPKSSDWIWNMMLDKRLGNLRVKHGNSIVRLIKCDRLRNENEWVCIQICLLSSGVLWDWIQWIHQLSSDTEWWPGSMMVGITLHFIIIQPRLCINCKHGPLGAVQKICLTFKHPSNFYRSRLSSRRSKLK